MTPHRGLPYALSAPALGLFGAQEILTGARDALLSPFHPDRPTLT